MYLHLGQLPELPAFPSALSESTRPGEGSGVRQDSHQSLGQVPGALGLFLCCSHIPQPHITYFGGYQLSD